VERLIEFGGNGADTALPEPNTANLDRAVDALAEVLRETGKYAFDLGDREASEIAALYELWAEHVLYATPPPNIPMVAALRNGRRDWVGLRHFVSGHRQCEHTYITQTLAGIREVIPQTLEGMRSALLGGAAADRQIQGEMTNLKQVAECGSVDALRREALSVVEAVGEIVEARHRLVSRQIEALQAQLNDLNQQLSVARAESSLDPLTRLDNRKAFDAHLAETLELRDSFQTSACLLLIDADHFKTINDTYGHGVGDIVLKALANCMVRTFVSQEDCVARYGGEEFAVILRDVYLDDAQRLAERLLETVRATHVETDGEAVHFTISIGIADLLPCENASDWLERADDALYRAKQTGRDRLVVA
jgi:diguanylate cyclase